MAIRPDYTIGTITLTSGSKDFTTVGSSLESAAVTGGDTIMTADGLVLIIDEITGQNSGTLLNESPVTVVDEPLVIRFQPDGSKYQGAARDLIGRWGQSGNVDAFAGLAGVVDGVPVFTGAGTMDVLPKSEFGPDDVYGNLEEIAALAKINNQFIVMGSDGSITLKTISDITDAIATNATNIATNADNITSLQNNKFDKPSGSLAQFLRGNGSPQSVVGTVTQAAGGAIIQRGSNTNGEFVRFADGTQICWATIAVPTMTIDQAFGAGFMSSSYAYPYAAEFIGFTSVNLIHSQGTQFNTSGGGQSVTTRFYSPVVRSGDASARIGYLAIGRWF